LPPSAISVAVSDAGPLIALGRLDLLRLLPQLFEQVQVPEAVLAECVAQPRYPDAVRIQHACDTGQLVVCIAAPVSTSQLGAGERSAIGRALEIDAVLLVDDRAARRHARSLGLTVIGTLGLLVHAKRSDLTPEIATLIEALRASGYWITDTAINAALEAADERRA
jgi:predicted nucleic acid-binding protein